MKRQHQYTRFDEGQTQMHDERTLIDQGLIRGMAAFRRTYGIRVEPVGYDALAVGLIRLFQQLPACTDPSRAIDALEQQAVTVGQPDTQEVA